MCRSPVRWAGGKAGVEVGTFGRDTSDGIWDWGWGFGGSAGRGAGRSDGEAGAGGLERSAASGDGDCAPEEVGDAWSCTAWIGVF